MTLAKLSSFTFYKVADAPKFVWRHLPYGSCRDVLVVMTSNGAKGIIIADGVHGVPCNKCAVYSQTHLIPLSQAQAVLLSYPAPTAPVVSAHIRKPKFSKKVNGLSKKLFLYTHSTDLLCACRQLCRLLMRSLRRKERLNAQI